MVFKKNGFSSKKIRKWHIGHVWLLWRFRRFVVLQEEARKAKDKEKEAYFWEKRSLIWASIEKHERQYGSSLGLKPEYIDEFSRIVVEEIRQDKTPDQIIKKLGHRFL